MTFCIMQGIPPEYVLSIDLLRFGHFVESIIRVRAANTIEHTIAMQHAAQADKKAMADFLKPLQKIVKSVSKKSSSNEQEFLARFGGGI